LTQDEPTFRVNLKYDYAPTQIQSALNELGVRLIIAQEALRLRGE